jgi:hypothetical protein
MNECKLGPTSPKNEGMKSANGVLIGDGTKTFCTVCFQKHSCLPLSFWEKDGWCPDTKFWVLTYTHTHTPRTCIIRQKNLCMGSIKMCLVITRHILLGQLGSPWKKMQTLPFFCTISNQGFYFIFGAISPKSDPKKSVTRTKMSKCYLAKRRWEWRVCCSMHGVDGCSVAPFWSNRNHPIPQKFSILRLEVAKDVTWWGRCIINYMVPKPSRQTPKASCRIETWQRQKLKLGSSDCLLQLVTC